jgi:ribosome-binding factor A
MSRRTEQVASLVQIELGRMMAKLELPAMTTISKIEVTPDLKWAKVGITILNASAETEARVLETLRANIYDMQGNLNRALEMKIVPRITFFVDKGEEYASRINELLRKAKEDESNVQ